ncbi:MAG: hypothetical protein PHV11_10225 [Candidatus Bipolaricaulis sp.]|nr:hypothetical protein [Candidatus Bipolaricaulis sp.]
MNDWKRKKPFITELRRFLRRFRILELKTETFQETEEAEIPTGGRRYQATGRDVVIVRLVGHWRDK